MPETAVSWESRFVAHLASLVRREDRGALAALRKGLTAPPATEPACYPYVLPFIPADLAPWKERVAFTIASLFALHPESIEGGNLGTSFRTLDEMEKKKRKTDRPSESIEKRFVTLLNAHMDDLPDRLRQAISLLRSNEVRVNWLQLLKDIQNWNREDRAVQRRWAAEYWGGTTPETQE